MLDVVIVDGAAKGIVVRNLLLVRSKNILLTQLYLQQADTQTFSSYPQMQ